MIAAGDRDPRKPVPGLNLWHSRRAWCPRCEEERDGRIGFTSEFTGEFSPTGGRYQGLKCPACGLFLVLSQVAPLGARLFQLPHRAGGYDLSWPGSRSGALRR